MKAKNTDHPLLPAWMILNSTKELKKAFAEGIPNSLRDSFNITGREIKEMPFPPKVVTGIREKDVKFLQETFGIPSNLKRRYLDWANHYHYLSFHFAMFETREKAREFLQVVREFAEEKDIPLAPLFLMASKAYLIWKESQNLILQNKRWNREANPLDQQTRRLREAVGELLDAEDAYRSKGSWTDTLYRKGRAGVIRAKAGEFIAVHGLKGFLSNLNRVIDEAEYAAKGFHRVRSGRHISAGDIPHEAYLALNGIIRLIEENWRPYGAKKEAIKLFNDLGIPVTQQAAKKHRQRVRKGDKQEN